jgi:hypothetical protein
VSRILALASNRTVGMIVECLLPDFPALDPATRAWVVKDVSTFVMLQVGALPEFLRYPYRLALIAFKWLPVLRWGRSFVALDEPERRAYLERWADSPLAPTRNFVKLIRSCALLAFYDHPAVQGPLNEQVARGPARLVAPPPGEVAAEPRESVVTR